MTGLMREDVSLASIQIIAQKGRTVIVRSSFRWLWLFTF